MRAEIKQLAVGPMMNFAYLIGDGEAGVSAAVDPGWDAPEIAAAAREAGWKIEAILLTHSHFDHAQAISDLVALTGALVYVHAEEAASVPKGAQTSPTHDGTVIKVGGLEISCIHTPGHTPGSQCFLVDGALFTGDTLFVDGCGRVDLPGSDPRKMIESLARLSALPPDTAIYPGHDYGPSKASTIADQLATNPCLSADSERAL